MSASTVEEPKTKKTTVKNTPFDKWYDEITKAKVDKVSIIMHGDPDPDAIASAYALGRFLNKTEIETELFWGGELTHTQNRIFVNVTGITNFMTRINGHIDERVQNRLRDYPIIIIDTSCAPGTGNLSYLSEIFPKDKKIDLVIDHHANQTVDPKYYHNESYGSCAAIIYEILTKYKQASKMDETVATCLYFAIENDTVNLKHESTTQNDIDYHAKLKDRINIGLYESIVNFKFPEAMLDIQKKCFKFYHKAGSVIVAGAGFILPSQKSLLGSIADLFLTRYDGISFVCVLGIIDEGNGNPKKMVASVRNTGDVIDTDRFMKEAFGQGFGGRKGVGGGTVELSKLDSIAIDSISEGDEDKKDAFFEFVFNGLKHTVLDTKRKVE
jgi:nanoRNase/pAp phosphatase (c-di-AMP/oligoRNAs hydrolase)